MAVGYLLKEGFSGFRRAKLAMSAAVFTITVSLLLLSLFSILFLNANSIVENVRNRVEMEAFLVDGAGEDDIDSVRTILEGIDGVEAARFIPKEEAARIFREEFGEDINRVLDFNPLPASFKITLSPEFRTVTRASGIAEQIGQYEQVEEVKFRRDLLEMLDRKVQTFLAIAMGVGFFILLASVFLVANTIRLAIYSKRKIIQTMKLIGATRSFIRFPFLLEGLVQGILGGTLAASIVYGVFHYMGRWLSSQLQEFVEVELYAYAIVVAAGAILGLLGSLLSIRRFIGESVTA